ncbi:hypothetical protein NKH69_00445 [Mesorhizobium sp. M0976]|uniref:hypothetical protein n=1 Tax=Mesorhizobium sp. M0976 TaxID=2957038 RepID=UPI003338D14B
MSMDLTDWNYRTPETLEDICRVLSRRMEVHQQWADYLRDYPNEPAAEQWISSGAGIVDKHLRYIAQYEAAIKLITAAPATLAVPGEMEPYAHEYGKTNGDGTFSVVIERGKPKNPVPDWPVKPLYAALAGNLSLPSGGEKSS